MTKGRLEAFSDGVIAIIITIAVTPPSLLPLAGIPKALFHWSYIHSQSPPRFSIP
ncbi:MAG TPA: TMEM175 family protein [Anaerolineales bacterium]|nr:TMEM175 family protein [Anaerolineales bacterium]